MLARARARDLQQAPLGFVDIVHFRLIGRVSAAFIERQNTLVASDHRDGPEFQGLGQAPLRCGDLISAIQRGDRSTG